MNKYARMVEGLQYKSQNYFVVDQHAYRSGWRDAKKEAVAIVQAADRDISAKDAEIARLRVVLGGRENAVMRLLEGLDLFKHWKPTE